MRTKLRRRAFLAGTTAGVALFGAMIEPFVLRRLVAADLAQVLVTPGLSFVGPISDETPPILRGATAMFGLAFPTYRLAIILIATVIAAALWLRLDRTRLGA